MKRVSKLAAVAVVIFSAASAANAQAKWWWEKYPAANDKTLSLQSASGGQVLAKQNPTGANGSVAGNNATQPPTVIIQQTASATAAANQLTCVQTVTPANGYYTSFGTTIATCPNIPGYMATPVTGGGYSGNYVTYYATGTSLTNAPILACCYVPVQGGASGSAAYSPWVANQAFNSNGFSGSQKQEYLTPGTYSWTVPAGVYRIWATVVGGGGGGGGGAYTYSSPSYAYGSGGGGRGGTGYRRPIDVIPGSTVTIKVGGGGVRGTPSGSYHGNSGSAGGNTYVTLNGYAVEAQGGYGGSGGYEATGYYPNAPANPSTFILSDPRGTTTCNASTCTGHGGLMGLLAVGSGSPISGVYDGSTGRGATTATASQPYGDGNTYNPTGAGKSGAGGPYGGGGGAAGFIGMPYSTGVPNADSGTSGSNGYGAQGGGGGYGYGAGGGGGSSGATSMSGAGNGGTGANGAVWIEW